MPILEQNMWLWRRMRRYRAIVQWVPNYW